MAPTSRPLACRSGQRPQRERDFHGEKRTNETHASTTDPEARLYRKGKGGRRSSPTWGTP